MFQTFHFIRPEWLFMLPVIIVMLFFIRQRSKQESGWEKICDPELLQYQLTEQEETPTSSRVLHGIIPLLLLLTIFALAGPSWEKKEQPVFQQGNALVIILDLSLSMNAKDIKPSRLERAKLKVIDILKQKKEGQTALIAYAGDAHTVSPLTIDNKTIMSLLPALDTSIMPLSGSHIDDALQTAKQLLQNSGFAQGDILLMSDGIDQAEQNKLQKRVNKLYQQGYRFSVIGIGSPSGSPIPLPEQGGFVKDTSGQVILSKLTSAPLKNLARIGGGSYHSLSLDDSDFKALIDRRLLDNDSITEQENKLEQWVDSGAYFTLILLPMALLAFRKGLMSIVVTLLLIPPLLTEPAMANENTDQLKETWSNLWLTPDQQAQQAFNAQNYQQAAETFKQPNWKAGAHYRAGDFEKAIEHYGQAEDATSLYNKGNSLANLNKFPEAIEAYEEALKQNPELQDAIANRDYLKELLKQQQQASEQNPQQGQNQQEQSDTQSENQDQSQQNNSEEDSKNTSQGEDSQSSESEQQSDDNSESESESEGEGSKQDQNDQANKEQNEQQNSRPQEPVDPESYQQPSEQQKSNPENMANEAQQEQGEDGEQADQTDSTETPPDDVLSQLSQEEQQSLKQWLQRIPDNPGELLRIKFRNNSLLKQRQKQTPEQYEGNPW